MFLVITYCLKAFRDFKFNFLSRPILIWPPHGFICPNPAPLRGAQSWQKMNEQRRNHYSDQEAP
jgi:hypothetical protein